MAMALIGPQNIYGLHLHCMFFFSHMLSLERKIKLGVAGGCPLCVSAEQGKESANGVKRVVSTPCLLLSATQDIVYAQQAAIYTPA